MEALARDPNCCGVTAIAQLLGITKSNAHRLLQTLTAQGYVTNRDGQYALTLKIWEMGALVIGRLDVRNVAQAHLQELSHLSEETVHLSILEGAEVVYIDKVDSPHAIRAYSRVGGRAPAYAVATGKVLLAHAADSLVEAVASNLTGYTPATLTSPDALREELARVRQSGFAVNRGEWRDGVWGVAAPIRDASDRVIAAIGVSGPAERFKQKNVRVFSKLVCEFAGTISLQLGYRVSADTMQAASGR